MKKLSNDIVYSCVNLLQKGDSYREISSKLDISKSMVGKIKKNLSLDLPLPKMGSPKKILPGAARCMVRGIQSGKLNTAVDAKKFLETNLNISVSPNTVRRALKSHGLVARVKVKKPLLSSRHHRLRLEFARKYESWTIDDWKRVIWSDETKINRYGSDGRQWCWKKGKNPLLPQHVNQTVKHGGGCIMVWGCMTIHGPGFLAKIDGGMDADLYCQILDSDLKSTIEFYGLEKKDVVFQHDNDPKHTAKKTKILLDESGLEVLDWPPQSPDLNPIEHLWDLLKRRLSAYDSAPTSIHMLWDRVQEEWEKITAEDCRNLIYSMPRRIDAVINAKGGHTKY
jgi:transposase